MIFSGHLVFSQVTGEWVLENYPKSHVTDVWNTEDGVYILVNSIHDLQDTSQYDYETNLLKATFSKNEEELDLINVFHHNTGTRRYFLNRLSKFQNNWIFAESTAWQYGQDTLYINLLDANFELIDRLAKPVHVSPDYYCSVAYGQGRYLGIASILSPPDSLVSVRYTSDNTDSALIEVFRADQPISFVSSIAYDSERDRFLVFHYGGISHLNDTLGVIHRYQGSLINTSQHGNVLTSDFRYYSFGANAFQRSGVSAI